MTAQTNALLYLRTAQADDAAVSDQRERCIDYAETRGWRVLDVIIDNGIGGLGDAPGLTILRDRIARSEAQAVIATDLTRISRDPEQGRAFDRFCREHRTDLCFVEPPVNMKGLRELIGGIENDDADSDAPFKAMELRL